MIDALMVMVWIGAFALLTIELDTFHERRRIHRRMRTCAWLYCDLHAWRDEASGTRLWPYRYDMWRALPRSVGGCGWVWLLGSECWYPARFQMASSSQTDDRADRRTSSP